MSHRARKSIPLGLLINLAVLAGCAGDASPTELVAPRPVSVCEAADPISDAELVVLPGDTLEAISTRRYGHRSYWPLILFHNRIASEREVEPGTRLRTPELRRVLLEECKNQAYAPAVEWMNCARVKYARILPRLRELSVAGQRRRPTPTASALFDGGANHVNVPSELGAQLSDITADLNAAMRALGNAGDSGDSVPTRTVGQLGVAAGILGQLSRGEFDDYGYDIDLVDQRLARGMTNVVLWARAGYR